MEWKHIVCLWWSVFFPSLRVGCGIKFRSAGLVAGSFNCWAIPVCLMLCVWEKLASKHIELEWCTPSHFSSCLSKFTAGPLTSATT